MFGCSFRLDAMQNTKFTLKDRFIFIMAKRITKSKNSFIGKITAVYELAMC